MLVTTALISASVHQAVRMEAGGKDRFQPCGPSLGRQASPRRDNRSRLDRKTINNRGSRTITCDEQGKRALLFFCNLPRMRRSTEHNDVVRRRSGAVPGFEFVKVPGLHPPSLKLRRASEQARHSLGDGGQRTVTRCAAPGTRPHHRGGVEIFVSHSIGISPRA